MTEVVLNGERVSVQSQNLEGALVELGYGGALVATALNGEFVPIGRRALTPITSEDRLEIIAPLQGG